jgi:hypothetical protein
LYPARHGVVPPWRDYGRASLADAPGRNDVKDKTTILLCDDHTLFREGIKEIL